MLYRIQAVGLRLREMLEVCSWKSRVVRSQVIRPEKSNDFLFRYSIAYEKSTILRPSLSNLSSIAGCICRRRRYRLHTKQPQRSIYFTNTCLLTLLRNQLRKHITPAGADHFRFHTGSQNNRSLEATYSLVARSKRITTI